MQTEFEWDAQKAQLNLEKHGVSFDEAITLFHDPLALTFDDPIHSLREQRYITIGLSLTERCLFVSHTDREFRIRIISARLATSKERRFYEQQSQF